MDREALANTKSLSEAEGARVCCKDGNALANAPVISAEDATFLLDETERALRSLHDALEAFLEHRRESEHGALVLAIASAKKQYRVATKMLELVEQSRLRDVAELSREAHVSADPLRRNLSENATRSRRAIDSQSSVARLDRQRIALRRLLHRAVEEAESGPAPRGGGTGASAAADTTAELRSLARTRALLREELEKVNTAVDELSSNSLSVKELLQSLQSIDSTITVVHGMLRSLLSSKSRDESILKVSVAVFVVAVMYVWSQRLFGFFAVHV